MSTAVEILEFSRDLIKAGWTRGVFAEDKNEHEVDPEAPNACAFCLEGAVQRAAHVLKPTSRVVSTARLSLIQNLPNGYFIPIEFNDAQHSEEPVVDLFDRAIGSLKEKA